MKPLRVLLISTSYPLHSTDWRGRFIYDLVSALAKRDDLGIQLWAPAGARPPGVVEALTGDDKEWLDALMQSGGIAHRLRGSRLQAAASTIGLLRRLWSSYRRARFDVAHVNWLQNALPLWGLSRPSVITVLGSDFGLLNLPGMKYAMRAVLRQAPAILAPNAAWMEKELTQAFGDVAEIRTIPFGVDARWYAVRREKVQMGQWLAVTRLTRAKLGSLFEWGDGLFGPERHLHLFGPMQEQIDLPPWVEWHGPSHPEELAQQWFPKATGLITLSRHNEGRPQVLLEAMASGLPIVVSDLPAHRDLVRDGETGCLVTDQSAFARALGRLDDLEYNRNIGETARTWVRQAVGGWDDCAARFASAYRDVVGRHVG